MTRNDWILALSLVAAAMPLGCGTRRITDTPRTASEQLLVSAAVDRATGQLDFQPLVGRTIYVDADLVNCVDKEFLIATVRGAAWSAGCRVMPSADEAEYVVELRAGAVGVDRTELIIGIPPSQVPTLSGPVPLPEVAAYKSINQTGGSRLSFVVYRREDRRFLYRSGPVYGFSDQNSWWLFGAGPNITDDVTPPGRGGGIITEAPSDGDRDRPQTSTQPAGQN